MGFCLKYSSLHLIHPLGFVMSKKNLERAALDYVEGVEIIHHKNFEAFLKTTQLRSYYSVSTKGEPMMNNKKITSLCVFDKKDKKKTIGILHVHTILQSNIS